VPDRTRGRILALATAGQRGRVRWWNSRFPILTEEGSADRRETGRPGLESEARNPGASFTLLGPAPPIATNAGGLKPQPVTSAQINGELTPTARRARAGGITITASRTPEAGIADEEDPADGGDQRRR
jgi:hypothetical protein